MNLPFTPKRSLIAQVQGGDKIPEQNRAADTISRPSNSMILSFMHLKNGVSLGSAKL